MLKKILLISAICLLSFDGQTQTTFPSNGAPDLKHTIYAFVNCSLHVDAETILAKATLVIQDGLILDVGQKCNVPENAVLIDLKGKHMYPAFIDLISDYGMPEIKNKDFGGQPKRGAYGSNKAIKSDVEAHKLFLHNEACADDLRKIGFGAVISSQKDGIVRGSGVLVNLSSGKENESIIKDRAAAFYSLHKGISSQDYPSSLMGAVALLRQTYYDALWYSANETKKEYNITLEAFHNLQTLPSIFEANDKYTDVLGKKISNEFKVEYIIKGGGNEYQRISDIESTYSRYIIPVNFPEAIDVEDPFDAEQITLSDLKHWEMAPSNLAALQNHNIQFCITSSGLKDKSQFIKNVRKSIKYGLSEKVALRALTTNPAKFIGVDTKIGSLKKGMCANFFISSKPIFDEDALIYETWSNGEKHSYNDLTAPDIAGSYKLNYNSKDFKINISNNQGVYSGKIQIKDTLKTKANVSFMNNTITINYMYDSLSNVRLSGNYNADVKSFVGSGQLNDGTWFEFTMKYNGSIDTIKPPSPQANTPIDYGKVYYPFCAYGEPAPSSEGFMKDTWTKYKKRYDAVLIKNATIWTNESDSILKDHDVYIVDGKIVRIAPNIDAPKTAFAKIIDAKGMHLTPGIIDEHSHIALFSANESGEASSAEVRMSDVVNPEDINIYRQLAGGVTTAQLLHGSANPIGGQSCLIKLRWGKGASELHYEKAPGFIKFALGENVKNSNGLNPNQERFPQTRMGVEQVFYDYFTRAMAYKKQLDSFSKLTSKEIEKGKLVAPRRDLDLDAIVEIIDGKRFITCHSYVQSEINMLLRVADSLKFKVNTFTHVLEGYKVPDKLKAHQANASTFADWWGYKLEVMDAIPYNAAMLTKYGINTAINSDDAEMGRRLNQEAAKTIKYGNLTEVQALKLITLNPAKMLHIDDKVGSIKVGKVGDVVLWTDNPLSIYAKVNTTIIDGEIYYDKDDDIKLREDIKKERARIIAKLIAGKNKGTKVVKPPLKKQNYFHCESEESGF